MKKIYLLIICFLIALNFIITPKNVSNASLSLTSKPNTLDYLKINYHLDIVTSPNTLNNPYYSAENLSDSNLINTTLDQLSSLLKNFPLEFFDSFYENNYQGITIYLTGKITPLDLSQTISNPTAYSYIDNFKYIMVIDATSPNFEAVFYHELMHLIENKLSFQNSVFLSWNEYNPEDFTYLDSYITKSSFNYTLSEPSPDAIYFIDTYSHTYAKEDRARIFEYLCTSNPNIIKYPHLLSKAKYLQSEILKYYPYLNNSKIFQILSAVS